MVVPNMELGRFCQVRDIHAHGLGRRCQATQPGFLCRSAIRMYLHNSRLPYYIQTTGGSNSAFHSYETMRRSEEGKQASR